MLQPAVSISFLLPYSDHTSLQVHVFHEVVLTLQPTCVCAHHIQLFATPWTVPMDLCPWDCPGKYTGAGCHFPLQGIFLTQASNTHLEHLPHCRWILYHSATWEALQRLQPTETTHHSPSDSQGLGPVCRALGNLAVPQIMVEW